MNGTQGRLLVAGDYGASDDDSESEELHPVKKEHNSNVVANTVKHTSIDSSQLNVNYKSKGE